MLYYLVKKRKWSPVACIGLLLLIGIVGGFLEYSLFNTNNLVLKEVVI